MSLRMRRITFGVLLLLVLPLGAAMQTNQEQSNMPQPRKVEAAEQSELKAMIGKRFRPESGKEIEVHAAGAYLFGANDDLFAIERTDLGSIAFETKVYGVTDVALEPKQIGKERLLPRVEAALREAGFDIRDKRFANFYDEFAGRFNGRKQLAANFDPRKASKLVARTVTFERVVNGLPVFGSELLIGLNSDGRIGRFRLHWPRLRPEVVKAAVGLASALRAKNWVLPKDLQERGTEILEVTAGVGHSAFADPSFRSAAVVRVLYRRTARTGQYSLASTGYKYFDASGREVALNVFPRVPGTSQQYKQ